MGEPEHLYCEYCSATGCTVRLDLPASPVSFFNNYDQTCLRRSQLLHPRPHSVLHPVPLAHSPRPGIHDLYRARTRNRGHHSKRRLAPSQQRPPGLRGNRKGTAQGCANPADPADGSIRRAGQQIPLQLLPRRCAEPQSQACSDSLVLQLHAHHYSYHLQDGRVLHRG